MEKRRETLACFFILFQDNWWKDEKQTRKTHGLANGPMGWGPTKAAELGGGCPSNPLRNETCLLDVHVFIH